VPFLNETCVGLSLTIPVRNGTFRLHPGNTSEVLPVLLVLHSMCYYIPCVITFRVLLHSVCCYVTCVAMLHVLLCYMCCCVTCVAILHVLLCYMCCYVTCVAISVRNRAQNGARLITLLTDRLIDYNPLF
jgi:hypothetical protein